MSGLVIGEKNRFDKLKEYFIYFVFYSIFGWLYEVFLEVVVYRWGFSNRGVLFGPYCPIYGFGALILVFSLTKLKHKDIRVGSLKITPVLVFIGIVVITTIVELIGSYIMEALTGSWMWDYTRFAMNFQGRVALNPSLRFGAGGMVFLYLLQPLYERITGRLSKRGLNLVFGLMFVVIFVDVIYTFFIK